MLDPITYLRNCADYTVTKLGVHEEEVHALNSKLYKEYGTTMAGLVVSSMYLGSSPVRLQTVGDMCCLVTARRFPQVTTSMLARPGPTDCWRFFLRQMVTTLTMMTGMHTCTTHLTTGSCCHVMNLCGHFCKEAHCQSGYSQMQTANMRRFAWTCWAFQICLR